MSKQNDAIHMQANVTVKKVNDKFKLAITLHVGNDVKTEESEYNTYDEAWGFSQGYVLSALKNFKEVVPEDFEWKMNFKGFPNDDTKLA